MVGRYHIKLLVNFLGEAMNPLFFNKTKQQAKTPEPNFDVSFVNLSNQLCAAINNLTGNMVLINKVESLNSNQQVSNNSRLQPFYGATIKIKSHSCANLGFSVVPNQTLTMQQLVVKTAKQVYFNYLTLLNELDNLLKLANQSQAETLILQKQQALTSVEVIKNIIKVVAFNQNPVFDKPMVKPQNMFCSTLHQATLTANKIVEGLIKLNTQIFQDQISNQLTILALIAKNIKSCLGLMLVGCKN